MRKLVVTEFVTLDGVVAEPQEWSFPYSTQEIGKFKFDEHFASDALLLGRVTYEGFAFAWPTRTDEQGFAERMNSLPKYVVSTILDKLDWNNSHLIKENVVEEIARLKQQAGMDIIVHGCPTLLQTLMQHDLVDEYHLLVYPIVLGKGKRLFSEGTPASLRLTESKLMGSTGVVLLRYEPDRK
jgi:dihydrofolate reductase